jgi:hypothetical protein
VVARAGKGSVTAPVDRGSEGSGSEGRSCGTAVTGRAVTARKMKADREKRVKDMIAKISLDLDVIKLESLSYLYRQGYHNIASGTQALACFDRRC